jgi:hypothetical protein
MTDTKLNSLFNKWIKIKLQLKELQEAEKYIHDNIQDFMIKHKTNKLETNKYIVIQKKITKEYINKNSVSATVWNKYCKTKSYNTLHLTKLK